MFARVTTQKIQNGTAKQRLATHVFQMLFVGIGGFRFPFAHFPVIEANSSVIYCMFYEAVSHLAQWGFSVKHVSMDGAGANRAFLNMNTSGQNMAAINEVNPDSKIHFVMDFSHYVKQIRNNIIKSCINSLSHFVEIFGRCIQIGPYKPITNSPKVNKGPYIPNPMRNHLAEDVRDGETLNLMLEYQSRLESDGSKLGVIELLGQTSKLIANFRDSRPLTQTNSHLITENNKVLKWFQDWESHTTGSSVEKKKKLMSYQCRDDLQSCIDGLRGFVMEHLMQNPR
ncbi:hypothetical protein KP79_PYT21143 [Mizuhopecten yessoensis]|uniref:THAP domain-containing protein 9 n=1 Tax=Mizuhopecten yessoensis TaxID=6573 RepID=A0A210Q5N0_MIZYE|nr:hypothetical protein KP79_PYT21143 [Mizuhopecten yessoensis]